MPHACLSRVAPVAISLSAAFLLAAPVTAQTLVDGSDPATIMEIARGYGSALMEKDHEGAPMIVGRIDSTRYAVLFYGCQDGVSCKWIQLLAAWTNPGHITLDALNAWNRGTTFGRAYMDEAGDPVLDYVINLDSGVTARNLDDSFDWWRLVLANFTDTLDTPPQTD